MCLLSYWGPGYLIMGLDSIRVLSNLSQLRPWLDFWPRHVAGKWSSIKGRCFSLFLSFLFNLLSMFDVLTHKNLLRLFKLYNFTNNSHTLYILVYLRNQWHTNLNYTILLIIAMRFTYLFICETSDTVIPDLFPSICLKTACCKGHLISKNSTPGL